MTNDISINRMSVLVASENAKWPDALVEIPREKWPAYTPRGLCKAFRSKRFVVQQYETVNGVTRLSISVTQFSSDRPGSFVDGISWDDLQRLKAECGFSDMDAVEVYPSDKDVVNDANMRHLWVLDEPLSFAWRQKS